MRLSFRAKKRLKTIGSVVGALALLVLAVWSIWLAWLGRFVVYRDGEATLDFGWVTPGEFQSAEKPEAETVTILYDDGEQSVVIKTKELQRLSGVHVTTDMLTTDIAEVDSLIRQLPKGSAILVELKNGSGNFFYNTSVPGAQLSSKVDMEAVTELLKYLRKADYYVIAAVPAFRDMAYGLRYTDQGIYHSSGGYLWAGPDRCYWLDPTRSEVMAYLTNLGAELRDLGFDEILFMDFAIPTGEDVRFDGDRTEVLCNAATQLVRSLAAEEFAVSFLSNDPLFQLPQGRTRLYRSDLEGSAVQQTAEGLNLPEAEIHLVCLTEAKDTRFDSYGVLRPLPIGQLLTEQEATEPGEAVAPEE